MDCNGCASNSPSETVSPANLLRHGRVGFVLEGPGHISSIADQAMTMADVRLLRAPTSLRALIQGQHIQRPEWMVSCVSNSLVDYPEGGGTGAVLQLLVTAQYD